MLISVLEAACVCECRHEMKTYCVYRDYYGLSPLKTVFSSLVNLRLTISLQPLLPVQ